MRPKTRPRITEVGVNLDAAVAGIPSPGEPVQSVRTKKPTSQQVNRRARERQVIAVPARLAWKDQRGISRFASVVTRDVSESGVFIECRSSWPIPLYRLVQFQVEPTAARWHDLPDSLRQGRILSAVYRVSHDMKAGRYTVALRLMVEPRERGADRFSFSSTAPVHAS
jgi:hypothetical protein